MSSYDLAAMSSFYALVGALGWLFFTGNLVPLVVAVVVAYVVVWACHFEE